MEIWFQQIVDGNLFHLNSKEIILDKLMEEFINASIKYGEAIEKGDYRKANKHSQTVRRIRQQLKENNKLALLYDFMRHENGFVRLNVAASLINVSPKESRWILLDLQNSKGLLGFEAKMFLQEWEKEEIM